MRELVAAIACFALAAGRVGAQESRASRPNTAALVARPTPPASGAWLDRLARLPPGRLRALRGQAAPWAARLIGGLLSLRAGRAPEALAALEGLLAERGLKRFLVETAGPAALRLCRRGDGRGLPFLEAVVAAFPTAAWARANLGLALRLLGRYRSAEAAYAAAASLAGRRAWILADWALVKFAEGLESEALALLEEGSRDHSDLRGWATCRTNLAVFLLNRALPGDRRRAGVLLRSVLAFDPGRMRASYYYERLRLGLS